MHYICVCHKWSVNNPGVVCKLGVQSHCMDKDSMKNIFMKLA